MGENNEVKELFALSVTFFPEKVTAKGREFITQAYFKGGVSMAFTPRLNDFFGPGIAHLPALGFRSGRCFGFHTQVFSQICWEMALFAKSVFLPKTAKIALNLTSEGLKCPTEVRVEHNTCGPCLNIFLASEPS